MVISLNIFISLSVSTILFPSSLLLSYEDAGLATKALAFLLMNTDWSGEDVQLMTTEQPTRWYLIEPSRAEAVIPENF